MATSLFYGDGNETGGRAGRRGFATGKKTTIRDAGQQELGAALAWPLQP